MKSYKFSRIFESEKDEKMKNRYLHIEKNVV